MRFVSPRDYAMMVKMNQELVNTVIDTTVLVYKLHQELTKTNSYSEATKKTWYPAVEVPCLIDRKDTSASEQLTTVDVQQQAVFNFLRTELESRAIYPEAGDIIFFDDQYYEIHNTNEVQRYAGRPEYNHSIVCEAHLTRVTNLQLEKPVV